MTPTHLHYCALLEGGGEKRWEPGVQSRAWTEGFALGSRSESRAFPSWQDRCRGVSQSQRPSGGGGSGRCLAGEEGGPGLGLQRPGVPGRGSGWGTSCPADTESHGVRLSTEAMLPKLDLWETHQAGPRGRLCEEPGLRAAGRAWRRGDARRTLHSPPRPMASTLAGQGATPPKCCLGTCTHLRARRPGSPRPSTAAPGSACLGPASLPSAAALSRGSSISPPAASPDVPSTASSSPL